MEVNMLLLTLPAVAFGGALLFGPALRFEAGAVGCFAAGALNSFAAATFEGFTTSHFGGAFALNAADFFVVSKRRAGRGGRSSSGCKNAQGGNERKQGSFHGI